MSVRLSIRSYMFKTPLCKSGIVSYCTLLINICTFYTLLVPLFTEVFLTIYCYTLQSFTKSMKIFALPSGTPTPTIRTLYVYSTSLVPLIWYELNIRYVSWILTQFFKTFHFRLNLKTFKLDWRFIFYINLRPFG